MVSEQIDPPQPPLNKYRLESFSPSENRKHYTRVVVFLSNSMDISVPEPLYIDLVSTYRILNGRRTRGNILPRYFVPMPAPPLFRVLFAGQPLFTDDTSCCHTHYPRVRAHLLSSECSQAARPVPTIISSYRIRS